MNVWRIGSRWHESGAAGTTIIDIFIDYHVLFVGNVKSCVEQVKEADLFAVTDGYTVVGLAKALSSFGPLARFKLPLSVEAEKRCDPAAQTGCLAHIILLKRDDWFQHKRRISLCRAPQIHDHVIELWKTYTEGDAAKTAFDINSEKYIVDGPPQTARSILSDLVSYCIPIYQRPYSWGEGEIKRFLAAIFAAVKENPRSPEPIFGGTMQFSEPLHLSPDNVDRIRYDIIDGQQRITTLILTVHALRLLFPVTLKDYSSKLRTLVNSGAAQRDYDETIKISELPACETLTEQNAYATNLRLILNILQDFDGELQEKDDEHAFWARFADFMLTRLYFVVIETHAGLSKTLQIFNAINTSGLDLNGTDLFKIRFYEFLMAKPGAGQDIFDAISKLYKDIEDRNRPVTISSMGEILSMLQPVIVAKYGLNRGLMNYDCDRFYGQLFDMLLQLTDWPDFNREKVADIVADKEGPLSVPSLQKMIEQRYKYDALCNPGKGSLEDNAMHRMMFWSRYPRYWFYPILFAYRFGESAPVALFRSELVKLLLTYSLIKQKAIYAIHACVQETCQKLFSADASPETVIAILRVKRLEGKTLCESAIRGTGIAGNMKWKNILCRLSEVLAYSPDECACLNEKVIKAIFNEPIDIEHIQSYHDKDGKLREKVWVEWGDILNGIGNLVVLESSINRSIGNEPFDIKTDASRDPSYHKSSYRNIHQILKQSGGVWTKDQCEKRRDAEVLKLSNCLFGDVTNI
jgi:hypothetical protein